jgi:hypothetical protein
MIITTASTVTVSSITLGVRIPLLICKYMRTWLQNATATMRYQWTDIDHHLPRTYWTFDSVLSALSRPPPARATRGPFWNSHFFLFVLGSLLRVLLWRAWLVPLWRGIWALSSWIQCQFMTDTKMNKHTFDAASFSCLCLCRSDSIDSG